MACSLQATDKTIRKEKNENIKNKNRKKTQKFGIKIYLVKKSFKEILENI
jgi:predicted nucleic acid-binding Zn ribbon protein